MLIENVLRGRAFESCIVGIGLNVNQMEFTSGLGATSIKKGSGKALELNFVFNKLVEAIATFYFQIQDEGRELLRDNYHQAMLGIGDERRFSTNKKEFSGVIIGTDTFGRLLLKHKDETMVFQHKEVQMLF